MIIVIDGPAGAGKSSTAKSVAARAGIHLLDTGAFYRMATILYLRESSDMKRLLQRLEGASLTAKPSYGGLVYAVDGEDVTEEIRLPIISASVSKVATNAQVRDQVNARLRSIASTGDFIAEGRDLGTVVFPEAELKFWMTADLEHRAKRRAAELRLAGHQFDEQTIRNNLAERDTIDSNRGTAPLSRASDAIDIDTSLLDFEKQVELVLSYLHTLQIKKPNQ